MSLFNNITIDITPLKRNRDFRLLFIGQFISFLGSSITTVALSYQIYTVSGSTAYVGLLGMFQLIPLTISGIIGGSVADTYDRKKIIIISESVLTMTSLALVATALMESVSVWLLFSIAAVAAFAGGFHRPALDALTPRVIEKEEIPAASALSGFRGTTAMILGPSIAGVILASAGLFTTYLLDALSFLISITTIVMIKRRFQLEREESNEFSFAHIVEGLRYAWSRKELLGTYFVDMMSMVTTYPYPLFPAIAAAYGNISVLGSLHASVAVGSFIASVTSGWIKKVDRHGKAITLAALGWCAGIFAAGLTGNLWLMLFFSRSCRILRHGERNVPLHYLESDDPRFHPRSDGRYRDDQLYERSSCRRNAHRIPRCDHGYADGDVHRRIHRHPWDHAAGDVAAEILEIYRCEMKCLDGQCNLCAFETSVVYFLETYHPVGMIHGGQKL
jgi:MFS family permease